MIPSHDLAANCLGELDAPRLGEHPKPGRHSSNSSLGLKSVARPGLDECVCSPDGLEKREAIRLRLAVQYKSTT